MTGRTDGGGSGPGTGSAIVSGSSPGALSGRRILVTGGARNVGKVIATRLAEQGAHVLVNYFHSHDAALRTRDELRARGLRVDLFRASVAREDQVARMFTAIEEQVGGLDGLVNSAASGALRPAAELEERDIDRALDTDYKGALRVSRAAARLMARSGGGAIVTVSALGGAQLVMSDYLACGAAKAAAEAMTRHLAVEFAEFGIRANIASAGMLTSEVAGQFHDAARLQRVIREATPFGRLGEPEELADVVGFLLSDASRWVTGQTVLADGGLSLGSAMLFPPSARGTPAADSAHPARESAQSGPETLPVPQPAARTGAVAKARKDEPRTTAGGDDKRIAVVGMGLVVAGANSAEEFWKLRLEGDDLFVPVPADRWDSRNFHSADTSAEDKSYQDTCVFVRDGDTGPEEYTTRWLRGSLAEALSGVTRGPDDRCSFTVGYTPDGSQHLEEAGVLASALRHSQVALDGLQLAPEEREELGERVRRTLRAHYWRGADEPSRLLPEEVGRRAMAGLLPDGAELQTVDTACSSSLYAIDIGIKGLRSGKHDIAVCGGAFALSPRGTVLFSKLQGLSRRGEVRSLDHRADGVVFADGAAVVVLKTVRRARADGDRILALVSSVGLSSDGKGKAVYAANPAGQRLAVDRARQQPDAPRDVDWVVAHATGTPAGDLAEFTTLRERFTGSGESSGGSGGDGRGRGRTVHVTSNKSLVGHTGWAAGAVSVIEVVSGLAAGTIPPQFRFERTPDAFRMESSDLAVPTAPVAWPPVPGRPRAAAVSGFGFGGTNAHLLVEEYLPDAAEDRPGRAAPQPTAGQTASQATPQAASPTVVVGWSARLPGLADDDAVADWIRAGAPETEATFGDHYPPPPFDEIRLPPATLASLDRCQLLAVSAVGRLSGRLGALWPEDRSRVGVFVGHMGPTRNGMLYADRCYLDDVEAALAADARIGGSPVWERLTGAIREQVRAAIRPAGEDAFPGMMPNIISARVANRFDLKGPNMTLDAGLRSGLVALDIAQRYLDAGDVDLALVGAVHGNSLDALRPLLPEPQPAPAEGAFFFALTSARLAEEAGLPVLAVLDEATSAATDAAANAATDAAGGPPEPAGGTLPLEDPRWSRYLGAASGPALLTALLTGSGPTRLVGGVAPATRTSVRVSAPPAPAPAAAADGEQAATRSVRRHVPVLRPMHAGAGGDRRPVVPFLGPGTLLLTDRPGLLGRLPLPEGVVVLSTAPADDGPARVRRLTPDAVAAVLDGLPGPVRQLRVLSDLGALPAEPFADGGTDADGLRRLHDAAFLCLQQLALRQPDGQRAFAVLLLGAMSAARAPHPWSGLFSGLVKTTALEWPDAQVFALLCAERDPAAALRLAEAETTAPRTFPVVHHVGGIRYGYALEAVPARTDRARPALSGDSVVVAVGGARGITAEVVTALARRHRPRLYLLGSNPLERYAPAELAFPDAESADRRAAAIRAGLAAGQGTVAELNRRFDRLLDARTAMRRIEDLTALCGEGRVTYLTCDLTDGPAVAAAMDRILAAEPRIDLLVNAAGRNRSALLRSKDLAEFRAVRDLKVTGYRNLKAALRDRPPRIWCNFGSLIGHFGQAGEADYASANDFLATAALWSAHRDGRPDGRQDSRQDSGLHSRPDGGRDSGRDGRRDGEQVADSREFTIGWTLWDGVGMGAHQLSRAYLQRRGDYSVMTAAEGVAHFLDELDADTGTRAAVVVHLGDAERRTVQRLYPDYFDTPDAGAGSGAAAPDRGPAGFYLRSRPDVGADGRVVFGCALDPEQDAYLAGHLVRGTPTLPGTFFLEMAVEAALAAGAPGLEAVALEDVRFEHFLDLRPAHARAARRITAQPAGRRGDLTVVRVRVSGDVVSPQGVVLVRDRTHCTATVLLAPDFPQAPHWADWDRDAETAVADPYHLPAAPVLLSGEFASTTDTRSHPLGQRARYTAPVEPGHPVYSRFATPALLLDGLARTAALAPDANGVLPVAAPLSIRRVDLYQRVNDAELGREPQPVRLYSTPAGLAFTAAEPANRFVATRADGRVIAQMKDLAAVVIGTVDPVSGESQPARPDVPHAKETP